jgi:hypothetical protein
MEHPSGDGAAVIYLIDILLWRFLCSSRIIRLRFEACWLSSRCLLDSFLFFRWRSSRYWKISIRVDSLWKIGTKLKDHRWRGSTLAIPMFRAFNSWRERMWALGGFDGFRQKQGCTRIYPGSAPRRVKTYILLVWSCIACIIGAVTMVRRWDLVEVKKEMACASLCVGSMRDQVSMPD